MLTKPNNSRKSKKRLRDESKRLQLLLKPSVLDLQRRLRRKKKRENLKNRNNLKNRRELKKSKLKLKLKKKNKE